MNANSSIYTPRLPGVALALALAGTGIAALGLAPALAGIGWHCKALV